MIYWTKAKKKLRGGTEQEDCRCFGGRCNFLDSSMPVICCQFHKACLFVHEAAKLGGFFCCLEVFIGIRGGLRHTYLNENDERCL